MATSAEQQHPSTLPPAGLTDSNAVNESIQALMEEHKRNVNFHRMMSNRRLLIPNKVSMNGLMGDQAHIVVDKDLIFAVNPMNLSDLDENQEHLNGVEAKHLLSSLVVRAIQVQQQHGKLPSESGTTGFGQVLNVSPMALHSSTTLNPQSVLPPIEPSEDDSRAGRSSRCHSSLIVDLLTEKAHHTTTNGDALFEEPARANVLPTTILPPSMTVTHAGLLIQRRTCVRPRHSHPLSFQCSNPAARPTQSIPSIA